MADTDSSADAIIGIIPIHFDVPGHYLPLATFVETASKTHSIIDAFNRQLFDGKLQYDVLVFPPDDGSFKTKLGLALLAGWGVVWSFTESDIGKGFIKGLTAHEPAYWAERAGELVKVQAQEIVKVLSAADTEKSTACDFQRLYETTIVVESTKSFLQTDQMDLRRVGITTQRFRDAYEARNGFYQACAADTKVRGIGLDDTDRFPIKRKDFARLQVALLPREDLVILRVTSPNWDREDRQRQWKARDEKGRERYFRIDDEEFWSLVQQKKIDPHIIDTVKVQMAFVGDYRRARVVRVLEYNDQILGEPLDDNALAAVLGILSQQTKDEPTLFDQ